MAEEQKDKPEVRDLGWKCPSCDNILGYIGRNGTVMRMKYKDFYVFIEEAASIMTLCRRCGRECVIHQST
jgi:hypothetical protein